MKALKLIAVSALLMTTACKEGIDTAAEKILYPFAYADFRKSIPEQAPHDMQQAFLSTRDAQNNKMKIHAWYHHTPGAQKTLVYFHGNNENMMMLYERGAYARFKSMGLNFVVIDYPGLGKSSSSPNQYNMTQAGLAAFDFALSEFPNTQFILWGRSLGAAVASQVAPLVQEHLTAFVLTSPWATFRTLAIARSKLAHQLSEEWLSNHVYDSVASARQMKVPSLVQHGKKDRVIPFRFGKQVYEAFSPGMAEFQAYPNLGHRNIFRKEYVWEKAQGFLSHL